MTKVKLLHNEKAGDEDHGKDVLVSLIESEGFDCDYASVKEGGWEKISDKTDFLIIAGGDGTVRKVIGMMLKRKLIDKIFPMAVLPLGTANNLAKTLKVEVPTQVAIESWKSFKKIPFDVGKIYGLGKKEFFIEAVGFGLFPYLIKMMQKTPLTDVQTPEEELQLALQKLSTIIQSYQPCFCKVDVDGTDYSGEYLMVEIMNIQSIGPNLVLAPDVQVDDGQFDVLLLAEEDRQLLADYISEKLKGKEITPSLKVVKGRSISLWWQGSDGHVDDQIIEIKKPRQMKIELQKSLLEFLV